MYGNFKYVNANTYYTNLYTQQPHTLTINIKHLKFIPLLWAYQIVLTDSIQRNILICRFCQKYIDCRSYQHLSNLLTKPISEKINIRNLNN